MIYDVIVIGAGQAGLAMGYYLKKSSKSFLILDHYAQIGDVWRERYDSLVLFTPRSYSSLHGLALEGDSEGFPTKDEVADYMERYANIFDLPVQLNTDVIGLTKLDGLFQLTTQSEMLQARNVVVATGPFHHPNIPSFSHNLPEDIVQLHSSEYKDPNQLIKGTVLVVGGGNSGTQIAVELSQTHNTYLSVGQNLRFLPISFINKSIFWWADKLGILKANRSSFIGKKLQKQGDPIFGYELKDRIMSGSVKMKSRAVGAEQNKIIFANSSTLEVNNIIWATGFKSDYSWINIPNLLNSDGKINHDRGMTKIDGLMFLGLPWQHRRGSALLLGVSDDAKYLYSQMK